MGVFCFKQKMRSINGIALGLVCIFAICLKEGLGNASTTPSALQRKTCGNTKKSYCHNGCCLDEHREEKCCYLMQTSEWCSLRDAGEIYCSWGCCYHSDDEICCNFWTMKYSFLVIILVIVASFLVVAVAVSCFSKCMGCIYRTTCQ